MEVTIRMVKKCGSGGGQSIQLSIRRRKIFEVTPAFRLRGASKRRFGATAAGGFNAARRSIVTSVVMDFIRQGRIRRFNFCVSGFRRGA